MEIQLSIRDEKTIAIKIGKFIPEDIARIKRVSGRQWIPEKSIWTIPNTVGKLEELLDVCGKDNVRVDAGLVAEFSFLQERFSIPNTAAMTFPGKLFQFEDKQKQGLRDALTVRGYSVKTIRAYNAQVRRFSIHIQKQPIEGMTDPVQVYGLLLLQQGYSHSYVNQAISALKFYFQHVLNHQETAPYIRPKKENTSDHLVLSFFILQYFR